MPEPNECAGPHLQDGSSSILDKINELHSLGVGDQIDLPQVIICGNRFSGKRSVIEAISRVRFPAKSSSFPRFVTEIRLRRHSTTSFKLSARAGLSAKNDENQPALSPFMPSVLTNTNESLSDIAKASELIIPTWIQNFSDEILELEISGPNKPDLTLVDLPGLDHQGIGDGAKGEDICVDLAKRYMKNPRSIILAVVSAEIDFQLQRVLDIVAEFNPKRERTIGIITHPDKIATNPNSIGFKAEITKRKLKLGWHALHNRSYESRNVSDNERDKKEKEFFGRGEWDYLGKSTTGIESLRGRLSTIFLEHAQKSVPGLIIDIDAAVLDRQSKLPELAGPRQTLQEPREFLFSLSNNFERIIDQALSGLFTDGFFDAPENGAQPNLCDPRRLRVLVRRLNNHFGEAIHVIGSRWVTPEFDGTESVFSDASNPYANLRQPECKDRTSLEQSISEHMQLNQATEIWGIPNQLLIAAFFRLQTKPLEEMAQTHLMETWKFARDCVILVLQHLTDQRTSDLIMRNLLDRKLEKLKGDLLAKLEELTAYNKRVPLLPLNQEILKRLNKCRNERLLADIKQRLPVFQRSEFSMEQLNSATLSLDTSVIRLAAADVIDLLQAHYDTSISTFIDNVAILGTENCLLDPLASLLTSQTIGKMENTQIQELASESRFAQFHRERLSDEYKAFRSSSKALKAFKILDPTLAKTGICDALVSGAALVVSPSGESFLMPGNTDGGAQAQKVFGLMPQYSTENIPITMGIPRPWSYVERDPFTGGANHYQTITFMLKFSTFSLEELRLADYQHKSRLDASKPVGHRKKDLGADG